MLFRSPVVTLLEDGRCRRYLRRCDGGLLTDGGDQRGWQVVGRDASRSAGEYRGAGFEGEGLCHSESLAGLLQMDAAELLTRYDQPAPDPLTHTFATDVRSIATRVSTERRSTLRWLNAAGGLGWPRA